VWLAAFEMSAHEEIADAHPEFHVVSHETLCSDPTAQFRRLAAGLGLEWTDECDRQIRDSNVPGSGFDTKRVTGSVSGKWRKHLSEEQVDVAREILSAFPIADHYPDLKL
jgi:hypothetical protein